MYRFSSGTLTRNQWPTLLEIKEKLGAGSRHQFQLERWLVDQLEVFCFDDGSHRRKELVAVGRWVAPERNKFGATPGSVSWGVWINQFPVGVYRMHGPPLSR